MTNLNKYLSEIETRAKNAKLRSDDHGHDVGALREYCESLAIELCDETVPKLLEMLRVCVEALDCQNSEQLSEGKFCGDCDVCYALAKLDEMAGRGMSACEKCGGTRWRQYDHNLSKVCEFCCPHDEGWCELTELYAGYQAGEDNRCCKRGCGMMFRDIEKALEQKE